MKGIIFNLLEDMVTSQDGDGAWDSLLEETGLDGGYSALGNYPDGELHGLLVARAEATGVAPAHVTRAFGQHSLTGLAERYPHFFEPHTRTRELLLTLNDVIHPEVRKLHAQADPPVFTYDDHDPDRLVIGYSSARRLCVFAEGMIAGAAAWFGESVGVTQSQCMIDGADHCLIVCTFDSGAVAG